MYTYNNMNALGRHLPRESLGKLTHARARSTVGGEFGVAAEGALYHQSCISTSDPFQNPDSIIASPDTQPSTPNKKTSTKNSPTSP